MIIQRSNTHWEEPEFWKRGDNVRRVFRRQGLCQDIVGTHYSYIPIGKVASTFMGEFLPNLKWVNRPWNYNDVDQHRIPKTYMVVLRDPVERWCSGM